MPERCSVLDFGKGSLRRAKQRRALAVCAPFWPMGTCDGLRREHFTVSRGQLKKVKKGALPGF
jgi:hypothetical protein